MMKKTGSAYHFPSGRLFWCLAFLYASFMAIFMQKLALPMMPELHAGHGLLKNDAIVFHNIAIEMAEKIRTIGWSEWKLFPGAAGNVGILSAVYALFGPDPAWFIPINAAAHATGAFLIYRMGSRLWPGNTGKLGGLVAGIAFLVFPSALQWYGQNHKDAFAIAGILIILEAWLDLHANLTAGLRSMPLLLLKALFGVVLLGVVRPYYPFLMVGALMASAVITSLVEILGKKPRNLLILLPKQVPLVMLVLVVAFSFQHYTKSVSDVYGEGTFLQYKESSRPPNGVSDYKQDNKQDFWEWKDSKNLPKVVDKFFKRASELRAHFIAFGRSVGASSEVDGNQQPDNAVSAIAYMPRALVVGLFAPFPQTWGERVSAPRLIGAVETAIWYLMAFGFVLTLRKQPSRQLFAGLAFCIPLFVVLAYIHPNVGTLYRQRFGIWQFVMLCGSVGWADLLLGIFERRVAKRSTLLKVTEQELSVSAQIPTRNGVDGIVASGAVVIIITLACYLGFLARDLLMVQKLGMNAQLDGFFTAMMIPMFFVTFLAMPMADAMMMPFFEAGEKREQLVQSMLSFAVLLLGGATVLVELLAPQAVFLVLGDSTTQKAVAATTMLRWFAPIILSSAWTVIGNAALNALGRSRDAALGQLVVPVATILALIFVDDKNAPVAAILGMLLGTFLNAVLVLLHLCRHQIRLLPALNQVSVISPLTQAYRRLMLAALLTSVLVPLNYAFAASVASGAVSAWALASKIVVLFTGLASVGASAVVLPHLAHLLLQSQKSGMQDDALFLLAAGSWIGGLLAAGTMLFAEPLVGAALSGSVSLEQVQELANIVKVGVLQLPVAIAAALVAKMAIVSGASSRVLWAAVLGLLCNLLVNVLLVPRFGVLGVAIGSLSGTVVSTLGLVVAARKKIGLEFRELLTLFVSWLAWWGVCLAVVSGGLVAMICAGFAILGMALAQFGILRDDRRLLINEENI